MNRELPEELTSFIGGPRPVLTNLYRALALALYGEVEKARRIWEELKKIPLEEIPPKVYLEKGMKKDVHYPAVLAALLTKVLGKDPTPYLEKLNYFHPEKEDTARLVTIGFYLAKDFREVLDSSYSPLYIVPVFLWLQDVQLLWG